jgi:sugar O-acyltransferase (sialic acid O-acetyltransferase NeuD family)
MPDLVIAGTGQPEIFPIIDDFNDNCSSHKERFNVIGFIDDNPLNARKVVLGNRVVGTFDWIVDKDVYVINAIARNCLVRLQSTLRLESLGARFVNVVHPSVTLSYLDDIGIGNIVSVGARLNPGVSIGSHNMFLTGTVLGHGTRVGSCCFFGHNVVCNGDVFVSDNVFIGSGCQVLPGVNLAAGTKLSPGSVLMSHTKECCQYVGNPARQAPVT